MVISIDPVVSEEMIENVDGRTDTFGSDELIMKGFNLAIILLTLLILFSSMDFKHKIIQWNCRGLKPNYNEMSLMFIYILFSSDIT